DSARHDSQSTRAQIPRRTRIITTPWTVARPGPGGPTGSELAHDLPAVPGGQAPEHLDGDLLLHEPDGAVPHAHVEAAGVEPEGAPYQLLTLITDEPAYQTMVGTPPDGSSVTATE